MEAELRDAVLLAASRADVCEAVEGIYDALGEAIELRRPICKTSGRCCRFEEFGHRLYVTTMELAKFVRDLSAVELQSSGSVSQAFSRGSKHTLAVLPARGQSQTGKWNGLGCPFQKEGLCGVHSVRPFGCRIFFCDETSTQWQHEQYELFHAQLRRLHDELGVPYHYVEWRFAVEVLDLPGCNE